MADKLARHLTDAQVHKYVRRDEQPFPKALVTAVHMMVCDHCNDRVEQAKLPITVRDFD